MLKKCNDILLHTLILQLKVIKYFLECQNAKGSKIKKELDAENIALNIES